MISPGALAATHARQAPKPTNKFRQGVRANESAKESAREFDRNKFRQKSVGYPLHTPSAARFPIAPRNNPPPAIPAPRVQSVPAAPEYREPPPTESVDS